MSLLLPAFLLVIGIMLYPLFYAFQLSFLDVKLYDMANRTWIGLRNLCGSLDRSTVYQSHAEFSYLCGALILGQVGGLCCVASVLNRPGMRGRRVFRGDSHSSLVASP